MSYIQHLPCLHCHPRRYIRMVHYLIERCLLLHMSMDQCIKALSLHASIEPLVTITVWKELMRENRGFFQAYDYLPNATYKPILKVSRFRRRFHLNMKEIIEKHSLQSRTIPREDQPSLVLQLDNNDDGARLSKQAAELTLQLRRLRGDDIDKLEIEELLKIEKTLESGLSRVLEKKEQKIVEQIHDLQQKGMKLMEENARLRNRISELHVDPAWEVVAANTDPDNAENAVIEDGQSSECVSNISHLGGSQDLNESADPSLKLGLPFSSIWK